MADRYLARFRANPAKVRLSVCRRTGPGTWCGYSEWWYASIKNGESGLFVGAPGKTALRAVVRAFQLAEEEGMDGIDRHMGWTFDHPQGAFAPAHRVTRIPSETGSNAEGK